MINKVKEIYLNTNKEKLKNIRITKVGYISSFDIWKSYDSIPVISYSSTYKMETCRLP